MSRARLYCTLKWNPSLVSVIAKKFSARETRQRSFSARAHSPQPAPACPVTRSARAIHRAYCRVIARDTSILPDSPPELMHLVDEHLDNEVFVTSLHT